MPQLPSGRHVAIVATPLNKLYLEIFSCYSVHKFMAVETVEDIKQFIEIIELIPVNAGDGDDIEHSDDSLPLPENLTQFHTNIMLANAQALIGAWTEEDQHAFWEYTKSPRAVNYFEVALKNVKDRQELVIAQYPALLGLLAGLRREDEQTSQEEERKDKLSLEWDDYDLYVAILIFSRLPVPEERAQLDLWHRMNATRNHFDQRVFDVVPAQELLDGGLFDLKTVREITSVLRARGVLEKASSKDRNWFHGQSVVFANDLFDLYEPAVLQAINKDAYAIIQLVVITEPTR